MNKHQVSHNNMPQIATMFPSTGERCFECFQRNYGHHGHLPAVVWHHGRSLRSRWCALPWSMGFDEFTWSSLQKHFLLCIFFYILYYYVNIKDLELWSLGLDFEIVIVIESMVSRDPFQWEMLSCHRSFASCKTSVGHRCACSKSQCPIAVMAPSPNTQAASFAASKFYSFGFWFWWIKHGKQYGKHSETDTSLLFCGTESHSTWFHLICRGSWQSYKANQFPACQKEILRKVSWQSFEILWKFQTISSITAIKTHLSPAWVSPPATSMFQYAFQEAMLISLPA